MKDYLKAVAILLLAGLFSTEATAVDVSISGTVIAFPCQVDPDSVSKNVDLGSVSRGGLAAPGDAHTWKEFDLKVINCPASITSLTATFNGSPAGSANNLYANTGTAGNVAVQVAQKADTNKIQGNKSTMTVAVGSDHAATFGLAGRVYSEQGGATTGSIESMMQVSFSYP